MDPCLTCLSLVKPREKWFNYFSTQIASTSVPGQQVNHLFQTNRGRQVAQRPVGSSSWWRDILRHSYRALAHARANVYAPARLYVPMLAATPPRWGTKWEVVRFSQAGCMPSQDVVLPMRSVVTFAVSSIGKIRACLLRDVHWNMFLTCMGES